jgi:hypothetical protein
MKISGMGLPARCSMTVSASANGTPSSSATAAPMVDLPAPGAPTNTARGAISG